MAKYLNKEMFLQSMGLLGDETKYGNRDREHQNRSYGTWMGYEIMGSVEDSIVEEDVVEVVRCKDCKYFSEDQYGCVCNLHSEKETEDYPAFEVQVLPNDFCSGGERKDNAEK